MIIKDSRTLFIVRAGSSNPKRRKEPYNFCRYCGLETAYLEAYHAFLCQRCGTIVDEIDPEQEQKAKREQQEQTYTIADGSQPYHPDVYTRSNIKHGKTFVIPPAGRTMAIRRHEEIVDRLRFKDGRSKEMDLIFKAQDRQLEATGRTITSDKLELKKSSNIQSSDELRAEKAGTMVDSSSFGRYNPVSRRRTRLSF